MHVKYIDYSVVLSPLFWPKRGMSVLIQYSISRLGCSALRFAPHLAEIIISMMLCFELTCFVMALIFKFSSQFYCSDFYVHTVQYRTQSYGYIGNNVFQNLSDIDINIFSQLIAIKSSSGMGERHTLDCCLLFDRIKVNIYQVTYKY